MRVVRILGSRGPPLPWDVLGTSAPPNPFKSSPTVGKSTFKKSGDARPPRRKTGCPAPSRGNWQNLRGAAVGWFFCYESWSTRVQVVPFCSQISASSQLSKICFGYQGIIFNGKNLHGDPRQQKWGPKKRIFDKLTKVIHCEKMYFFVEKIWKHFDIFKYSTLWPTNWHGIH